MRRLIHADKHRAGTRRRRRRTHEQGLRVAGRRGRNHRPKRLQLFVGQLLRLVQSKVVAGETAPGALASGDELDGTAVFQDDGFLAVRLADISDQSFQLRVVGVVEVFLHAQEMPSGRFDLVGRVENPTPLHGRLVQLGRFDQAVLAVLSGQDHNRIGGEQMALGVGGEPVLQDDSLPRVAFHAVGGRQRHAVIGVVMSCRFASRRDEPERRLLVCSQCHDAPPAFP